MNAPRGSDLPDIFWSKVDISRDGCWEWSACLLNGYGCFAIKRKNKYAHRLSYESLCGPIPRGMFVCHRCDNRKCVNPDHLFIGSARDNSLDMMGKGRHNPPIGESNGMAKIRAADAAEILRSDSMGKPHSNIAQEFGVSVSHVKNIVARRKWKSVA